MNRERKPELDKREKIIEFVLGATAVEMLCGIAVLAFNPQAEASKDLVHVMNTLSVGTAAIPLITNLTLALGPSFIREKLGNIKENRKERRTKRRASQLPAVK